MKTSHAEEGSDGRGLGEAGRPRSQTGITAGNRRSLARRGLKSDQKCAPRSAGKPTNFGPVIPQRREDDFNERLYRCGNDGKSIRAKDAGAGNSNSSQASLGEIDEKLEGHTVAHMQSYQSVI